MSFDCPNEITFRFIQQTLIAYRTPYSVNHKMTIIIGSFDFIARSCEKIIYAAEQIFIATKQETRTKNTTVTKKSEWERERERENHTEKI